MTGGKFANGAAGAAFAAAVFAGVDHIDDVATASAAQQDKKMIRESMATDGQTHHSNAERAEAAVKKALAADSSKLPIALRGKEIQVSYNHAPGAINQNLAQNNGKVTRSSLYVKGDTLKNTTQCG